MPAQVVLAPARRRDPRDDRFEDLLDPDALLGAAEDRFGALDDQEVLDLALHALGIGRRQIDLVDDRDDREVVLEREVVVRERLRLDALRRVDDEQRALARGERARDLR